MSPISEFWPLFGRVTNLVSPITHSWRRQVSPPKTAVSPIFGFWDFEAENRPRTDFRYFPLALCLPPLISLDLGPSFQPFLKRFAQSSVVSSSAAGGIEAGSRQGVAGETIALAWRAFHLFWEEDFSGKTVLPGRGFSLLCRPSSKESSPSKRGLSDPKGCRPIRKATGTWRRLSRLCFGPMPPGIRRASGLLLSVLRPPDLGPPVLSRPRFGRGDFRLRSRYQARLDRRKACPAERSPVQKTLAAKSSRCRKILARKASDAEKRKSGSVWKLSLRLEAVASDTRR